MAGTNSEPAGKGWRWEKDGERRESNVSRGERAHDLVTPRLRDRQPRNGVESFPEEKSGRQ